QCLDVTALDWYVQAHNAPNPDGLLADGEDLASIELPMRFQLLYQFLSHASSSRLHLSVWLRESDANVPSLTSIYPGVNFFEREVFDMFGIHFVGHPFMKRILMPDNWQGYPLRKDHPLGYETVEFTHNIDA